MKHYEYPNPFPFRACEEALEWLWPWIGSGADLQTIWDSCPRGDWLLWMLGKLAGPPSSDSRRQLVYCAAECAALALPIWEAYDPADRRPHLAIAAAKNGDPDAARAAASASYAARAAAYAAAYAAADAAYAAARAAADAARAAAYAACAAARAAARGAYAAADAAYAARKEYLAKCADIVRRFYPRCPEVL